MEDDEIDDWLDSSDDEAGEAPGATPRPSTPSFLAETTPDSTPAREAVTAAPAEEAPEAAAVAAAPVGVDEAIKEAPSDARPAPPSGPTPSAVSVEPPALAVETAVEQSSPVAEEMTDLSLSSPKAADLPEPSGASSADSPAADAYVSLEDAVSQPGARERVPGASGAAFASPSGSEAPATFAGDALESDLLPSAPAFKGEDPESRLGTTETLGTHHAPHAPHDRDVRDSHDASPGLSRFAGGDGSDPAWTLRRGGGAAEAETENGEPFFGVGAEPRGEPRGFGFGSLLGASLGSVTAAVAAVTTAAARSDLARDAADHARGVGKELGTLAKHVAGEDLARSSLDDATNEETNDVVSSKRDETRDETRDDDLWSAFGAMAKHAAKSIETAAVAVASDPNVTLVASRSAAVAKRAVAAAETRAFDFLEKTLGDLGERTSTDDSRALAAIADEDGVLLERALIERGCATHLEALETLADAADAFAEEKEKEEKEKDPGDVHSTPRSAFGADALASADAALDVEMKSRDVIDERSEDSDTIDTVDIARAGGPVPGEDASELTGAMRADAEAAARDAASAARAAFSGAFKNAPENAQGGEPLWGSGSETPSHPSPESIEAALRTSLEPTRRESAARVADVAAAVVAHLVDVADALQTSPGFGRELSATRASGTVVARAWPSPASTASPGDDAGDTTPASISIARARLIGARVRAMAADADGVADAFAAATVAAFSNASDSDIDIASLFPDAEAFAAFLVKVEKHATNTAARLKEVSMGYAADAARCLRAVVAASAQDAAAAAR